MAMTSFIKFRSVILPFVLEMVLQCLKWIWHLLNESVGLFSFPMERDVLSQLPDDVIVDILSRLPAEFVLECRRVCRTWRSLTSSEGFIKLHLSRATTTGIFLHFEEYMRKGEFELGFFIYDPTMTKGKKIKKLRLRPEIVMSKSFTLLFDSCDGLLLFRDWPGGQNCYVFNPVTQEQISIACQAPGYVCAFFYNPGTEEYNILYYRVPASGCTVYFLYTVGDCAWRSIKSPPFNYVPNFYQPAILNGALHWISNWNYENVQQIPPCTCGVVVFDMNTEEFSIKPHPGDACEKRLEHRNMSLFDVNGNLFFCHVQFDGHFFLDIWTLEDYANWVWVRKWKLDLIREEMPTFWGCSYDIKILHIENGQLLLDCSTKGLFLHELDNNTVKKLEGPPLCLAGNTRHRCTLLMKSLVSLHQLSLGNKKKKEKGKRII